MTASPASAAETGLVPLSERLRYMQLFRATVVLTVLLAWVGLPAYRHLRLVPLVVMSLGYLAVSLGAARIFRRRRTAALRVFALTLLMDGVYLAFVSYGSSGFGIPLQYLVLLHLVAVTLLASFRTGVKLALWHSLVATAVFQLHTDGQITFPQGPGPSTGTEVVLFLLVVWMGALFTASFASVNERELRRRNYDLQALARLSWQLESALAPEEVGEALLGAVRADFDVARLVLLVRSGDHLVRLASRQISDAPAALAPENDRLLAQCLRERRTLRLARPPEAENPWLAWAMPDAENVLVLPLYSEGTPLGVLALESSGRRGARIERRAVEMLERFVSQAALALANARLLAQVRALAAVDGLTGVANRRTFDARLAAEADRSVRSGRPLSVVLFDVDHFKRLNDLHGHQAGDEALQRVAATLSAGVRSIDLVARYGGEEFVVILPDTDLATAGQTAERLRRAVEALPTEPRVTASLGVAALPRSALDPTGVVAAADEALYEAKQGGRNRVVISGRLAPASPADLGPAPVHPAS